MRFFILVALCGLAAAWYPTSNNRGQAFNQLLQNMKYRQVNNLANRLNIDEEDLVDTDQEDIQEQLQDLIQQQQRQQQCYPGQYDEDTQEDEEDEYDTYTYQGQSKYGTPQNAKQAQQQCIQKQQECAQAQQHAAQNPQNKQKANKAHQKCAQATQKCDHAQQQSQNENQQQGGQDQQQQGANAQQQCANAQQQCANAQQQIANTKKHTGQTPQQQQQAANAQQQCANAQQQCANAQQQYANTQQQNGAQNQQQQQEQQQTANQQQHCANAQQKCADTQQAAANAAQQGYGNQQQQNHAQQKCAQAQQQCANAQQQSAQAQNQAAQDPEQTSQNPQCVHAQQQCGQAQQKCANAHQECNQAQQTGNQQQCAQTQKHCAKAQQKCAQAQKPCQGQGPNGQKTKYNKYTYQNEYGYDDEEDSVLTGNQNRQLGGNPIQPNYQALQQLEQPNSQLAAKLYKQAKQERDDKNTVVSPAAVQLALAALQKGAKGNTKAQIKRAHCAGMTQQKCQQAHAALIRALKGSNNVQQTQKPGNPNSGAQKAKINVPNAIVVNQQTPPKPQYTQAVQKGLGGQVKTCPFKHSPQQCRKQINQLISAKTNHKLQKTVPRDAVTDNTKMIAVSAAQLQAKWGQQFRQNQKTKVANFYPLGNQQPKQCQAIESKGVFNYYEDEQVQVVGIPTQQQELTVYVIVPKDQDGLNQVEKSQIQNGQQLKQLLENTDQQQQYVKVQIPKFQAKHKLDAKKTLQQQGVQDAFDNDQADFSGINSQQQHQQQTGKQLHLNKLIHQATIKVNEQGVTAATPNNQNYDEDTQDQYQEQLAQQFQQTQQEEDYEDDEDQEGPYGRQQNQGQYDQDDQGPNGQQNKVRANRAFAFAVKHNPSNQIVLVGRVVDGCQKPNQQTQQDGTVDGVDQD